MSDSLVKIYPEVLMKLLFALCLFSFSVFAAVTPAQMAEIRKSTPEVMYAVGADPELNATILDVRVVSELGSRVKVKFTYTEDMYGKRSCTYYYDLKAMDVVANSWLCGL